MKEGTYKNKTMIREYTRWACFTSTPNEREKQNLFPFLFLAFVKSIEKRAKSVMNTLKCSDNHLPSAAFALKP